MVSAGNQIVGIGSWADRLGADHESVAWLYVDETPDASETVIDHLLEHSINRGVHGQLHRLDLRIGPAQVKVRDVAIKRGFCSPDFRNRTTSEALTKVSMKGPVTKSNWRYFRNRFRDATGREMPTDLPRYEEVVSTGVVLDAEKSTGSTAVSLFDFETVISPGVLICPGRIAVMVPIREEYACQLLSLTEGQGSLWADREAVSAFGKGLFPGGRPESSAVTGNYCLYSMLAVGGARP